MDENVFWLSFFKIIAIAFCTCIALASGCTMTRQYQTRLLIENAKVNPIEAKCAMEADVLSTSACVLKAAK